jgi:hypothetical protein
MVLIMSICAAAMLSVTAADLRLLLAAAAVIDEAEKTAPPRL